MCQTLQTWSTPRKLQTLFVVRHGNFHLPAQGIKQLSCHLLFVVLVSVLHFSNAPLYDGIAFVIRQCVVLAANNWNTTKWIKFRFTVTLGESNYLTRWIWVLFVVFTIVDLSETLLRSHDSLVAFKVGTCTCNWDIFWLKALRFLRKQRFRCGVSHCVPRKWP